VTLCGHSRAILFRLPAGSHRFLHDKSPATFTARHRSGDGYTKPSAGGEPITVSAQFIWFSPSHRHDGALSAWLTSQPMRKLCVTTSS
jgi:hypothetical protein